MPLLAMADHCHRSSVHDLTLQDASEDGLRWRSCWGGFRYFSVRKREKQQKKSVQPITVEDRLENGILALDGLSQAVLMPAVMYAPPTSPASFYDNTETASSCQSSATFVKFIPAKSAKVAQSGFQFEGMSVDAVVGPFTLDNVLVTPPVYSTLTTAPTTPISTAPFTPPPELAHLTSPSSPEVPFAQLLATSLENKCALSKQTLEHSNSERRYPSSSFEMVYQLYPCRLSGQLASRRSGASSSEILSPVPETHDAATMDTYENISFAGFGMKTAGSSLQVRQNSLREEQCAKDTLSMPCQNSGYNVWQAKEDSRSSCCKCGELSEKYRDLSEALEKTKEKLLMIEKRVDSLDEKERKLVQLLQWIQLGAKLQEGNVFQLSNDLPLQEEAFFDLEGCRRTEPNSIVDHS